MIPTLKKALAEPSGISRVGLQIVSSVLLDAADSARLIVADPYARRLLCFLPDDRSSEFGLLQELSRIARSLQRSLLSQAWAWARGQLASLGRPSWQLPAEFSTTGGRGVFLLHGMNIKRGFLETVKRARRQHAMKVVLFLHDLLPLTQPPHYTDGRAKEFRNFLAGLIDSCDLVITSSRYTAAAFPEVVARITNRPLPPVAVVPLAHEYRPWQPGSARPALPRPGEPRLRALCRQHRGPQEPTRPVARVAAVPSRHATARRRAPGPGGSAGPQLGQRHRIPRANRPRRRHRSSADRSPPTPS